MSSIIQVDQIQTTAGDTMMDTNGLAHFAPGQIIESLCSPCDGSTVVGRSGSYTWPNVTSSQTVTEGYTNAGGSVISYTPPAEATKVVYEYIAHLRWADALAISHWRLYIDGAEVVYARTNRNGYYPEDKQPMVWVFNIGTANANTGAQATWTAAKEIKWMMRDYGTGNERGFLHQTVYWDGANGNQFSMPLLKITAIA